MHKCALDESKDIMELYCYGWIFVHVQKVMLHANNIVLSISPKKLHNLGANTYADAENINFKTLLSINHFALCWLVLEQLRYCTEQHCHLLSACAVRTASGVQCSGFSLARKDAIIGILTNNTRIHHSHGNINHSDTRHLQLSARFKIWRCALKKYTLSCCFRVNCVLRAMKGTNEA